MSQSHTCIFCNKTFSTISSLNFHKKTTKYCLKIQSNNTEHNTEDIKEFACEFCDKICTTKYSLSSHILSCKGIKYTQEIQILQNENNKKLQILQNENNKKIQLLQEEILKQKSIIDKLEFVQEKNQEYIKIQEEQNKILHDRIQKLAIRAIDRPTSSTNNSITNKLELNNFITPENVKDKIQRKFNDNYIPNGMKDVAKFVYEWILKTDEGNLIYACYDRSRLIFKYKDESGNEVRDPKASQLSNILKPELIKKLTEMLNYVTEELEYISSRKERDLDIDIKEYDTFKFLKDKALELGFELTSMTDNNLFCKELANLIY